MQSHPSEPVDETFERAEDEGRSADRASQTYEAGMGEDEHGEAPGATGTSHRPSAGLDDPRVPRVPETTPNADESDAQAAARVSDGRRQDPWGEPEDRPDHDDNEAYRQQDRNRT
jgi:hypothetical protein